MNNINETFKFLGLENSDSIPLNLNFNNQSTLWFAMIGLAVSFVLLATSKMASSNLVFIFSRVLYKNATVLKVVKEEYNLNSLTSVILTLNFIITSSILLYLSYINYFGVSNFELIYFLPIIPVIYVFWPMFCLNFIGFISKEGESLKENKFNTLIFAQILGVIFSLLLLIWTFNMKWSNIFVLIFAGITGIFWLYRIFRGFFFSIQKGIAWYYLFLYFCTLEILPLILIYSVYNSKIESVLKFL